MTTHRYIMGIDPGFSGAISVYCPSSKDCVCMYDMPTRPAAKGERLMLDLPALVKLFDALTPLDLGLVGSCFVEEPSAMPGQGVTSMFRFGHACGAVQAMAYAFGIPNIVLVRPAVWKSAMGLSSDKNASREKATKLFPAHADLWKLKKHDGRAEALLLAVFGARYV